MPFKIGGYYVLEFKALRRIMAKLEIPDKGVNEERLEFPINDWLAKTGNVHILAGAIVVPGTDSKVENGMMIMIHLDVNGQHPVPAPEPVVESERDLKVKKWLMEEGGAEEAELRWMVIRDRFGITRKGIRPTENNKRGRLTYKRVTHEETMALLNKTNPKDEFENSGKESPFW